MPEDLPQLSARLPAVIQALAPESVLIVGTLPGAFEQGTADVAATHMGVTEAAMALKPGVRYDLAIAAGCEDPAPEEAAVVLARLRDLCARHVLVITTASAAYPWRRRDLVAFGYVHLGDCRDTRDHTLNLFEFDISTYKTTPDWLSPRNWANPELWDRYRW